MFSSDSSVYLGFSNVSKVPPTQKQLLQMNKTKKMKTKKLQTKPIIRNSWGSVSRVLSFASFMTWKFEV